MNNKNEVLFLGDVVPFKPFKFKNEYSTIINLECPIIKDGTPANNKVILKVEQNYLKDIFNSNLISVCLGNNHILDYGQQGLKSTTDELEKINTSYFGIRNTDQDRNEPLIIEHGDYKIALLSVICESTSPVISVNNINQLNLLDIEEIIDVVKEIRSKVDRIVLYIHWGIEESSYPAKEDILKARKLIDSGVDIVIGSHAHSPQPVEKYRNGIIAYNLGNFIMPELVGIPTYFNDNGIPQSSFTKRLMPWNRISWGLLIDLQKMEFTVRKYVFISGRIIELPFTHLDKYLRLDEENNEFVLRKHLRKRALTRKLIDFIYKPHIPQILRMKA